ncbi:MAG: matrixin family metalloprotease [Nanoarchaeota archaeon]|nr:matrixin family metalloprotease [Nanoarchaeota archaeon]
MEEEGNKQNIWKLLLILILILVIVTMLFIYWFVPFNTINLSIVGKNSNFSLVSDSNMQFYNNMRFPYSEIQYKIYDCPLNKKNSMEDAFRILENKTILSFFPVAEKEEISITCDSRNKFDKNLFIAGEGGPTNITKAGNFNVIFSGKILLIRESKCGVPNVELHELLHVLGFDHSSNPQNIMYNLSSCGQTIGDDVLNLINELYSIGSFPDLVLKNVSSVIEGRYINANISLINEGLVGSKNFSVDIYADGKLVKEIEVESLEVGYGKIMVLNNLWVNQISINELTIEIDYPYFELNKENNKLVLREV